MADYNPFVDPGTPAGGSTPNGVPNAATGIVPQALPQAQVPSTIPAPVVSSASGPAPAMSLYDQANQERANSGLPALQSRQKEILDLSLGQKDAIQSLDSALQAGITNEEGRAASTFATGGRVQEMQKDAQRRTQAIQSVLTKLTDEYSLNASSISDIEKHLTDSSNLAFQQAQLDQKQKEIDQNAVHAQNADDINLIQTLGSIPEGQQINIGGKTFTGLKQVSPDVQLVTADDGSVLSVDKKTNKVTTVSGPDKDKAAADLAYKKAQINSLNANAAKDYAAASGSTSSTYQPIDPTKIQNKNAGNPDFGGLSYNGLLNAAKLYLSLNGKMPTLGLGQAADVKKARLAVANYAGQIADSLGLDASQISAMYKANSTAASTIITRVAKIEATAGSLSSQFPRLAELASKVGNLGITESDLTAGKAAVTRKFGSVDAGNYVELLQTVRSDYSAMQSAVAGSQGAQYFSEAADKAIPLGLTPDQYTGLQQTIEQSSANSLNATQTEANRLIGNIGNPSTGGNGKVASDINLAIKDTANFPTRESLISALAKEYPGISQDEITKQVYSTWTDNTKR